MQVLLISITFSSRKSTSKIYYDKEVDAAYIRLSDAEPSRVVEISERINVGMMEDGQIVGIEILDASKKFPLKSLFVYELDDKLSSDRIGQ